MKVSIEISNEFLWNQVAGANIDYWASSCSIDPKTLEGHVTMGEDPDTRSGHKALSDYDLNWERAVRAALSEKYAHLNLFSEWHMDANTGDVWVQLAAFGEVVYG